VLAGIRVDQLGAPTPCVSWKVQDVIDHILGAQGFFVAGVKGTPAAQGEGAGATDDFVGAFDEAAAATVAAFQGEGVMSATLNTPMGPMPGSALMGLATTDTFVHGWDVAKATGQPTDLEPALAAELLEQCRVTIPDAARGPEGAPFGPEQPAPAGASNADKLAAFLGRRV
jgi:uncharacterized protein (TIGR03086 family)